MLNRIIPILMERDGMTKEEARIRVQEVREEIMEAIQDGMFDEVEDIMYSELSLEMDYIEDILP